MTPAQGGARAPTIPAGLIVLLLATGAALTLGAQPHGGPIVAGFCILVALGLRRLSRVAWILLLVLMIAGVTSALDDASLFAQATRNAAFLTSLIAALLLLGRIVGRVADVRKSAQLLVHQPQGRRYVAITLGTHLLAIILNFGSIALVAAFLSPQRDTLERQGAAVPLTLAMLRGFAAMPMWSPLALSVLITLSLMPTVSYWRILPMCVCAAVLYTLAGIALDRRAPVARGPAVPDPADITGPARPVLLRVFARCVALVGGVVVLHWLTGLAMIDSVFAVVLGVIICTGVAEVARRGLPTTLLSDLDAVGRDGVNELVILATAAFVGTVLTHYLHGVDGAIPTVGGAAIMALTALVPTLMVLCGALAINPILSGTVLIGALQPIWPQEALHLLAFAVIVGWGITSAGTPFTANVLIAARSMQIAPGVLAFRGNARLTLWALIAAGLFGAVASQLALARDLVPDPTGFSPTSGTSAARAPDTLHLAIDAAIGA